MKRKIIQIDEDKCNGCGSCIPDCPEGAFQLIDGKARLVSDLFCDGLGACVKSCPQNALTVTEREAEPYNESRVMANIVLQGKSVIKAHLEHLIHHGEKAYYNEAIGYLKKNNIDVPEHDGPTCQNGISNIQELHACPGSAAAVIDRDLLKNTGDHTEIDSELRQWPVQLKLLNPMASYFDNADLLIAADCVPFAYGDFHRNFLKNKIVIMFCPKLDSSIEEYIDKMSAILSTHNIKSITVARMEVPCCGGVNYVLQEAMKKSGKNMPIENNIITIKGEVK